MPIPMAHDPRLRIRRAHADLLRARTSIAGAFGGTDLLNVDEGLFEPLHALASRPLAGCGLPRCLVLTAGISMAATYS
jgi:hypothetical protein